MAKKVRNIGVATVTAWYTYGENVAPNEVMWMRDEDAAAMSAGALLFWQILPQPVTGGVFPWLSLNWDTTDKTFSIGCSYSTPPDGQPSIQGKRAGLAPSTFVSKGLAVPYNAGPDFKRWVDFVVHTRTGYDLEKHNPFLRVYRDTDLIYSLDNTPIGAKPPFKHYTSGFLQTEDKIDNMVALGIYPPSPYLTPNTERNMYLKRFIACRNKGKYTLADIRAALVAPL